MQGLDSLIFHPPTTRQWLKEHRPRSLKTYLANAMYKRLASSLELLRRPVPEDVKYFRLHGVVWNVRSSPVTRLSQDFILTNDWELMTIDMQTMQPADSWQYAALYVAQVNEADKPAWRTLLQDFEIISILPVQLHSKE